MTATESGPSLAAGENNGNMFLQEKTDLLQTNRGEGGEELKQDPGVVPSVLHQPTFSLNRFLSVYISSAYNVICDQNEQQKTHVHVALICVRSCSFVIYSTLAYYCMKSYFLC